MHSFIRLALGTTTHILMSLPIRLRANFIKKNVTSLFLPSNDTFVAQILIEQERISLFGPLPVENAFSEGSAERCHPKYDQCVAEEKMQPVFVGTSQGEPEGGEYGGSCAVTDQCQTHGSGSALFEEITP